MFPPRILHEEMKMLRKLITATVASLLLSTPVLAQDVLAMSWDEIVAQAKTEGEVTWYVWYFQPEFREYVKTFEAEYGIKVNIPEVAALDDVMKKLLAETARAPGDIDVMSMGGEKTLQIDMAATFLGPILPVLPEAANLTDKINGGDGIGYGVAYWGNQTGLAYDSNRVDAASLPQTLEELDAWITANPGQLGFNFEKGGSGPSFIHNIARNILGVTPDMTVTEVPDLTPVWDWFNTREDKFVFTASNADSLTRLNAGEFLMVPAWEDGLFSLIGKNEVGANIKFYVPNWGMNGGGNMVAIPANAPHKAASLVFVAWLTSAANQTAFNQKFGTAPTNTAADSSMALVPDDQRANARIWTSPIDSAAVVPAFIEQVVQN
jgi:putative spermidine/putrescine transport system substrate-binding protein